MLYLSFCLELLFVLQQHLKCCLHYHDISQVCSWLCCHWYCCCIRRSSPSFPSFFPFFHLSFYPSSSLSFSFFVCVKVTDCSKLGRVDRHDSVLTRGKLELLTNISILLLTCRDHCTMNWSIMVVIHKVCLFEKLARGK